jgi:hypothetical protein
MSAQRDAALSGLKDFQLRTVEHVSRCLLDEGATRFLVADEVGLGKTLVARGVIANTVERLQEEGVKRIDVVYVCSNLEIAKQNLDRLRLPGSAEGARLSRIGLLPMRMHALLSNGVNFVSLTPGTSLDPKSSSGWSLERAILLRMLQSPWDFRITKGVKEVFRVNAGWSTMQRGLDEVGDSLHAGLCKKFGDIMRTSPLRETFDRLVSVAARRHLNSDELWERLDLIGDLRRELSRVCIGELEPDLVVLDEFQRFGHLLDGTAEDAVLARQLFEFDNGSGEFARVLLLSATPYRAFTRSTEEGASHQTELLRLLRFLFRDDVQAENVERQLRDLREVLLSPHPSEAKLLAAREALERNLAAVMVRTERLASSASRNGMLVQRPAPQLNLRPGDIAQWLALARLHSILRKRELLKSSAAVIEYWKSAPWLAQFMDHYEFKQAINRAQQTKLADDPELAGALRAVRRQMSWKAFERYEDLAPSNARMRSLAADTVDKTWDLVWLPPSMPYYLPGPPFDRPDAQTLTKRLIFSAWNVVPRAIAGFVSYEAERRAHRAADAAAVNTRDSRTAHERRLLDFRTGGTDPSNPRPTSMPVLAWMYPSPTLADLGDPREAARTLTAAGIPSLDAVLDWVRDRVSERLSALPVATSQPEGPVDQRWYWAAPLLLDRTDSRTNDFWNERDLANEWSGGQRADAGNWGLHVDEAADVYFDGLELGRQPDDLADVLAKMAVAGPGVTALRALGRVLPDAAPGDAQLAAARIAWGLRHVLNGPEAIAIITAIDPDRPYWRASLHYALHGNLQALLDEWLHLVAEDAGAGRETVATVLTKLRERVDTALNLGASRVEVDRLSGVAPVNMRTHFAVRYGQFKEDGTQESVHPEAVRRAFNSPFRPFVLATTSVGQEGLDFHTYCHAIVHWNVPSNPVDLEQREGRVHRYKGHAVRRNVAAGFADEALRSAARDPWTAAFDAARDARAEDQDDLVPYWLQDGPAAIERYVLALPFSKDAERLRNVLRQLTLYRMVFGQPRQEDLITYLRDHMGQDDAEQLAELARIDLGPRHLSVPTA